MKILIASLFIITLYSQSYVVVTHKNSHLTQLKLQELQALYLSKTRGETVVLNQCLQCDTRVSFEQYVLNQNRARLNAYWIKQHYLGIRPPKVIQSEKGVILFLKNFQNSIGYIQKSNLDSELKILYEWSDK